MDHLEALQKSGSHFLQLTESLDQTGLAAASVCAEWTVGDIVEHVIGGCRMSVALTNGASTEEAVEERGRSIVGPLIQALRGAVENQDAALRTQHPPDFIVHHPIADMTAPQLIEVRVVEFVVHGSDIARSSGQSDGIEASLAEVAWAAMAPLADFTGALGVFGSGPSGRLGGDATAAERLLDVTGRGPI